jgi:hypothetical protein
MNSAERYIRKYGESLHISDANIDFDVSEGDAEGETEPMGCESVPNGNGSITDGDQRQSKKMRLPRRNTDQDIEFSPAALALMSSWSPLMEAASHAPSSSTIYTLATAGETGSAANNATGGRKVLSGNVGNLTGADASPGTSLLSEAQQTSAIVDDTQGTALGAAPASTVTSSAPSGSSSVTKVPSYMNYNGGTFGGAAITAAPEPRLSVSMASSNPLTPWFLTDGKLLNWGFKATIVRYVSLIAILLKYC